MYHSFKYAILSVMYSIMNYISNSCIGYKMANFRNSYAIDITNHFPSLIFFLR